MTRSFAGFEVEEVHGTPLLWRRDQRCKTFRISLLLQRPMGAGQAARALLPLLLQHGSEQHQGRPALARARERLFGAGGGTGCGRHGESTVLSFAADAVAGEFLPQRPDQFTAVRDLLQELLLRPRFRDARAGAELFARERSQALAAARAVWDDKAHYARQRAVAAACAGEPYGVPDHGGEAAIAALLPHQPAAMLDDALHDGRRLLLMSGVLPDDPAAAIAPLLAALPRGSAASNGAAPVPPMAPAARPVGRTVEYAPMQQAKLVLVFRMPRPVAPGALHALQIALSLWGGGAHSRLFQEVRERRSLCYYAAAGGDADKGLCMVQVGCDAEQVEAVTAATLEQLAAVAGGDCSDAELATAVATCQGPFRSLDDSPAGRLAYTAEQWLRGFDETPAQRVAGLGAVARDAVTAAAASIALDHEYRLLPAPTAAAEAQR